MSYANYSYSSQWPTLKVISGDKWIGLDWVSERSYAESTTVRIIIIQCWSNSSLESEETAMVSTWKQKKYLDIVETINSELFGELSKGTSTKFESSSWIFKSKSSSLLLSSINIDQYHDHNDHEDLLSCCCDRSGISQLQLCAVVPRQQTQRNPLMTMMMMMMMMINYTDDNEMMKLVMMM